MPGSVIAAQVRRSAIDVYRMGRKSAGLFDLSRGGVFFHAVDELDTSRTILVPTGHRPDLVDDAHRDHCQIYELGDPEEEALR